MPRPARQNTEKDEGEVRCVCNNKEDHRDFISCDKCFVWQHMRCVGVNEQKEPEHYYCDICSPKCHVKKGLLRHFELSLEEFERLNSLKHPKLRTIVSSPKGQRSPARTEHKSRSSKSKGSKQAMIPASDSPIRSPSPKFTTQRGRKTARIAYSKYSARLDYEEEVEFREITVSNAKVNTQHKGRKKNQDTFKISDDKTFVSATIKTVTSSPIESPHCPLPPMQAHIESSQNLSPLIKQLGSFSPIPSPMIPPMDMNLPPILTQGASSPVRPRVTHGRLAARESLKRVENMKKYILDFQSNLKEHPDLKDVFKESAESAKQLLKEVLLFEGNFGR